MDFYYCSESGTYGVEWRDFYQGSFNLVPQYVYKDTRKFEMLKDACDSQWTPSSLHAGLPSESLEKLICSPGMNWGSSSKKSVELLGNAHDMDRIVQLVKIQNLNIRHEDFYPVGIATSGYALTEGTQLIRVIIYLK